MIHALVVALAALLPFQPTVGGDPPVEVHAAQEQGALQPARARTPVAARGLHTQAQYRGAIFRWESAPDWVITDVTFGVRGGALVFARYTAVPPGSAPKAHDNSASVDQLVDDTLALPGPVRMLMRDGREVLVHGFSIGVEASGEAFLDALSGTHPDGGGFSTVLAAPGDAKNGACGAARVFGTCDDEWCTAACTLDLPDRDPCDCSGTGWCTDGTAKIVCNSGTCSRHCDLNQNGLCGCFDCNPGVAAYCVAKVNSQGCSAAINWFGGPHLSQGNGFSITADDLLNNVFGIFFYSKSGPANLPFQGGILCMQPPVVRTPAQNSGGVGGPPASNCSGSFHIEFTPYVLSGVDPGLVPGASLWGQYWYRDPPDPFGSGLSNAIQATICP